MWTEQKVLSPLIGVSTLKRLASAPEQQLITQHLHQMHLQWGHHEGQAVRWE